MTEVREAPSVSVLTAVRDPNPEFLLDAYRSLREQAGPVWEWLIQIDAESVTSLPREIERDVRASVQANGCQLGTAGTRNRALLRSRAELVQNLDGDDQLLAGALDGAAAALGSDPSLAFAFGRTVDLRPDGSRRSSWREQIPFAPGRIEPGTLDAYWLATGHDPLPMSPLMWRKSVLYAFGGWAALSVLEDAALIYPVAALYPCYYLDHDTQLYRIHSQQRTASSDYRHERAPNRQFVFHRLQALRELGGRAASPHLAPPPDPADTLSDRELRREL